MTDDFGKVRKVSGKGVLAPGWDDAEIVAQQFCKEVILWNLLTHPCLEACRCSGWLQAVSACTRLQFSGSVVPFIISPELWR